MLQQLRPSLKRDSFDQIYKQGHEKECLQYAAIFEVKNKCLAVVGWRIQYKTVASMLYVDDLVVIDEARGRGIGSQIIEELKKIASKANCQAILLDTARPDAKKSYKAIGMSEAAAVFVYALD